MNSQEPPAKKPKPDDATPVNEHQPPPIIPYAQAPDMNESKRTATTTHWNAEQKSERDPNIEKQLTEQAAKFAEQIAKDKAELEGKKDKQLAEQAEKLAEKDKQLAEKDKQLAEQAEKFAEQAAKFAEQIAEQAKQLYKNSVGSVVYNKDSPSSNIKPSVIIGTRTSHSYPRHDHAAAHTRNFTLHYLRQAWEAELKNKFDKQPSAYRGAFEDTEAHFHNESNVQNGLNSILIDASKICNGMISTVTSACGQPQKILLATRTESSLFSNIIDHIVVYDEYSDTPIFAVETKKILDETVKGQTRVLGQALDQLRAMKLMGHPCPFGALSCHNATFITWLDSGLHNGIVDDHNRRGFDRTRLQKIINPLPTQDGDHVALSQSPIKMAPNAGDVHTISPETNVTSSCEETVRQLCISQQFDQDKIVDVFVNAIFCSLHDCYQPRTVIDFKLNFVVEINEAIGLTQMSYKWHNFRATNLGPLTRTERDETKEKIMLYLVSYVGRGATSKVYRAISESGHDCVIKMFVQRRDSNNQIMTKEDFLEASKKLADDEFANYKAIYADDNLLDYMWRETLNNLHCIIMPFFEPIKKEDRNSERVTMAIRQRLKQFGRAKKVFKPDDQSWRHIGCFQDKLYLFDLGNLEKLGENISVETYITGHLDRLKGRAGSPTDHSHNA